jgi:hypothetical protein
MSTVIGVINSRSKAADGLIERHAADLLAEATASAHRVLLLQVMYPTWL